MEAELANKFNNDVKADLSVGVKGLEAKSAEAVRLPVRRPLLFPKELALHIF